MHGNIFGTIHNLNEADITPYQAADAESAQSHASVALQRRFNPHLIKLWG